MKVAWFGRSVGEVEGCGGSSDFPVRGGSPCGRLLRQGSCLAGWSPTTTNQSETMSLKFLKDLQRTQK